MLSLVDAVSRSRILLLVVIGFISTLPAIVLGFPFFSHDGAIHALMYSHFAEQFWAGELYPRWLVDMNGGFGSPEFFYYPPVAYYLTSPFKLLFLDDPHGWRQLGVSASLAQIASGLCAYLWLNRITSRNSAFIAAALYMLMPYHLAFDLYTRGAFAEFWTFVWMPLVLYFVHGIAHGRRLAAAGLSVSYALLIMTHLLLTLMFSLVPVCYALYLAKKGRRTKAVMVTSGAMALGIGLAAVYLLPALTSQEHVQMQELKTGYFYYENWFLITGLKPWGGTAGYFWITFDAAGLALCAYRAIPASLDDRIRREAMFWAATSSAVVFMMTPLSKPIWQIIPALQMTQFPWRFNAVLCVALAALLALGVSALKESRFALGRGMRAFALLLFAYWLPYAAVQAWRRYPITRPHPKDIADIGRRMEQGRALWFRPRWATSMGKAEEKGFEAALQALRQRVGRAGNGTGQVNIVEGSGKVLVREWKAREIRLEVETSGGASLDVSQFYYPGWSARTGEGGEALTVRPSVPDGLVNIFVPSGSHEITLRLERGSAERWGQTVSAVSALAVLLLSCFGAIWRRGLTENSSSK